MTAFYLMPIFGYPPRLRQHEEENYLSPNNYGKMKGGDAVLMEMQYFRETHYPATFQPVSDLDELAQQVYEFIRLEPAFTGPLRKRAIEKLGCTKSQFDTAIKKLQISLNIVRSNDTSLKNDFWLTMQEVHLDLVNRYEINSPSEPTEDGRVDR